MSRIPPNKSDYRAEQACLTLALGQAICQKICYKLLLSVLLEWKVGESRWKGYVVPEKKKRLVIEKKKKDIYHSW